MRNPIGIVTSAPNGTRRIDAVGDLSSVPFNTLLYMDAITHQIKKREDDEMVKFLYGVVGIIQGASSDDSFHVWETWHDKVDWASNNFGLLETVGTLDGRPICINLSTATIEGFKVLFYYPTSELVDWAMIENWVNLNLSGVEKSDASNAHNIIHHLQRMKKEAEE